MTIPIYRYFRRPYTNCKRITDKPNNRYKNRYIHTRYSALSGRSSSFFPGATFPPYQLLFSFCPRSNACSPTVLSHVPWCPLLLLRVHLRILPACCFPFRICPGTSLPVALALPFPHALPPLMLAVGPPSFPTMFPLSDALTPCSHFLSF